MKRMLKNRIHYFLLVVLLNSLLLSGTLAISTSSLAFHGVGLTVNLDYPEEAHPTEEIYHNVTITSQADLTISNLTLTIYGTVNQTQQEITNLALFSWKLDLNNNNTLTNQINFTIPQDTFERLYCTLYAKTSQDIDYFFTSFYTTHVHTITFSELLIDYNLLLTEIGNNLILYESLNQTYYDLIKQKDNLNSNYNKLYSDYQDQIDINKLLESEYASLNLNTTKIQESYVSLNNNYTSLNQTNTELEQEITILNQEIDLLDQEISVSKNSLDIDRNLMIVFIIILVSLIGLIIYLRNKQKEPYVVIRKETVSVKPKKN